MITVTNKGDFDREAHPFTHFPDASIEEVIDAAEIYHACDEVEIDEAPEITETETALWVQAWVRIDQNLIDRGRLD